MENMRVRIVGFLSFMGWSHARLTEEAGLGRGRISYLLKREDAKIGTDEWAAIQRVIDSKLPHGGGESAPVAGSERRLTVRENLMAAISLYVCECAGQDPVIYDLCRQVLQRLARSGVSISEDTPAKSVGSPGEQK